jgi:hypothetical protein
MDGRGSGQWTRWDKRPTVETVKQLDSRYMHRQGLLHPGTQGPLTWHQGARETGSVWFSTLSDAVVLVYNYRAAGGDWEPVEFRVPVERTPCHFGGTRPWFRCPRCDRRVGVLYDAGKWFWCRHCTGLPYASSRAA